MQAKENPRKKLKSTKLRTNQKTWRKIREDRGYTREQEQEHKDGNRQTKGWWRHETQEYTENGLGNRQRQEVESKTRHVKINYQHKTKNPNHQTWLSKMHLKRPFTWNLQTFWLVTSGKAHCPKCPPWPGSTGGNSEPSSARSSVINRVYLVSLISTKQTKTRLWQLQKTSSPRLSAIVLCSFLKQTNQHCHPHYAATDEVWGGERVRRVWTSLLALSVCLLFHSYFCHLWTGERDAANTV